jgi:hypothetical protein
VTTATPIHPNTPHAVGLRLVEEVADRVERNGLISNRRARLRRTATRDALREDLLARGDHVFDGARLTARQVHLLKRICPLRTEVEDDADERERCDDDACDGDVWKAQTLNGWRRATLRDRGQPARPADARHHLVGDASTRCLGELASQVLHPRDLRLMVRLAVLLIRDVLVILHTPGCVARSKPPHERNTLSLHQVELIDTVLKRRDVRKVEERGE